MTKAERLTADAAENPILFYRGDEPEWGFMSNFTHHPVWMPNQWSGVECYDTTEHYFQACKATTVEEHSYVRLANSPGQAKARGREIQLREDWGNSYGDVCYLVMVQAVIAKAMQHLELARALEGSGGRHIYEDSPVDDIWGWRFRQDYNGKNLLGQAWMDARLILFGGR